MWSRSVIITVFAMFSIEVAIITVAAAIRLCTIMFRVASVVITILVIIVVVVVRVVRVIARHGVAPTWCNPEVGERFPIAEMMASVDCSVHRGQMNHGSKGLQK